MPKYEVLKPGFLGGVFREPGGKHDPVITSAPLKKVPSWLAEIKPEADPVKKRGQVTKPNEKVADFMGEQEKDNDTGLETL